MNNGIFYIGNKLYLEIYLIGYKRKGESLLICIKDSSNKPLWTAVIDCYKFSGKNITIEKLEELGYGHDKKIDLFMITHPDNDHINDIDKIMNDFTDKNTIYMMPDFLSSNVNKTIEMKKIDNYIRKRYSEHLDGLDNNIFYNDVVQNPNLKWKFTGSDSKAHVLRVESYLPTDSIMSMSRYAPYQKKNDYSLFINIIIDDSNYVFTGDCLDYALGLLNEDEFSKMQNTLYFKIPHHGSKYTTLIKDIISSGGINICSVSACAYSSGVTDNDVLKFYCDVSKSVSITSSDNSEYDYGLLKHVFDVANASLLLDKCESVGNACLNIKPATD